MPISRADFEPVASQKCPDFIDPKNRGVRDLLIAPIKTGSYWEATCSKSALKSAQKRLVSSSTCSIFAILNEWFWSCCLSVKGRFYWPKKFSSSRYTVLANKIEGSLRGNMLKSGPQKMAVFNKISKIFPIIKFLKSPISRKLPYQPLYFFGIFGRFGVWIARIC